MKLFASLAFIAALAVGQATAEDVKQLYHVTAPKVIFDAALSSFGDSLDIWEATVVGANVKADVYATEAVINKFYATPGAKNLRTIQGTQMIQVQKDAVNTQQLIEANAAETYTCAENTRRHLSEMQATTKYVDNAFFDCWRTADQVFAFLDTLVSQNAAIFKKTARIATTIQGRSIPSYKLSTGTGKKAIYVQGLIHAREWHAGSTTFYTIAALLDAVRNNDANLKPLVDRYDWVFVPIVNLDGYIFTHASTSGRLWRKNRRLISGSTYGVDLNRNFGPASFFGRGGEGPTAETYPGTAPLSEPETAGVYAFLKTLPLAGALDVHAYSNLVLRPFGNQNAQAPAPYGAKLKTLGDNVKTAIEVGNTFRYTSQTAAQLYLAYGSFMDSIFLEFNRTATLSFEMEGNNFVQPCSVIRPGGLHVFQGIAQFARELTAYYA